MSSYLLLTVFVMAVMTYLPRMLPLTFFKKEIHSRFIRSLLYYVPYAVLSALTFPSIRYATGHMGSALVGGLAGIYFAYRQKGLVFVACVTVICSFIAHILIPF